MKRKIYVLIILALMIFQMTASACAPAKAYTYDNTGSAVMAPDAMMFEKAIDTADIKDSAGKSIGRMKAPSDLFVDHENRIYIADTDNKRVVVLNSDYTLNRLITSYKGKDGKVVAFVSPTGIYVDDKLNVYICDRDNHIVVELDKTGNVVRTITVKYEKGTETEVLEDKFDFRPLKIVMDDAGRLFIVCERFNKGLLELDKDGIFVKTVGAPRVIYDTVELFWRMISTKETRDAMQNFVPTEFANINIDKDGFVYAVTDIVDTNTIDTIGPVKKLNAKGNDVLRKVAAINPYGDANYINTGTYRGPSLPYDVMTLPNDMYAILDRNRCRVFFYDADGQLLFQFGGPPDSRDQAHKVYSNHVLQSPSSIAWVNNSCLVLDKSLNTMKVFSLTNYGSMIMKATALHYQDKYEEEAVVWSNVLKLNRNNLNAKKSLADVAYRNKEYKLAMKYYFECDDRQGYSNAYKYARREAISSGFTPGVLTFVAIIIFIVVLRKLRKKYLPPTRDDSYLGHLKYSLRVIFRPINSYWSLMRENRGSMAAAITILGGACLMSVFQARFTGFIFTTQRTENINIVFEILKIVIPVLLFCICNWCVTSLLNGEGNLKAIFVGTSYALTPIILLFPFAIVLSNVMVLQEGDFYTVFLSLAMFWVTLLIISGNMRIHDYTLFQSIGILFLTAIVMFIIVFLSVLFFALMQQVIGFIRDVSNEIATRT